MISGDFPGIPVVKNPPYNAEDTGSIPGQGTKIPHAAGQLTRTPRLLSSRASTREPVCRELQSPCATTGEEKTHMPQLERSPHVSAKDPACLKEDPACHN